MLTAFQLLLSFVYQSGRFVQWLEWFKFLSNNDDNNLKAAAVFVGLQRVNFYFKTTYSCVYLALRVEGICPFSTRGIQKIRFPILMPPNNLT
jgi:hypothetical protein